MSNLKKILRVDKKYTSNTFFLNIKNFSLKKIQSIKFEYYLLKYKLIRVERNFLLKQLLYKYHIESCTDLIS